MVVGGDNGTNSLETTEMYDILAETWLRGPDFPVTVHNNLIIKIQGKIYSFGGKLNDAYENKAFEMDPVSLEWREKPDLKLNGPYNCYLHVYNL